MNGASVLIAGCGALIGAGVFAATRAVAAGKPSLAAALSALYEPPLTPAPTPVPGTSRGAGAGREFVSQDTGARVAAWARAHHLQRLLIEDDLALAGRSVTEHTTARLLHALLGAGTGLFLWAAGSLLLPLPLILAPALIAFAVICAVIIADHRVQVLAQTRRAEAPPAVAAYVDLVSILLIGGLPLGAALRTGAEQGSGWTFTQLRAALTWASDRGLGPDAGLQHLATRYRLPEFADLALTIASARRGASPVTALESKAAFMRGAATAQARAEDAVIDAKIELPSALVAFAFTGFLAYPLMSLLTTTLPGVTR